MIRAGQLRQRIDVLHDTDGVDAAGQPNGEWQVVAGNVPAEVVFKSGTEAARGPQTEAVSTHEVRLRWRADVRPDCRLRVHRTGQLLSVVSVGDPSGKGRELLCTATEVAKSPG